MILLSAHIDGIFVLMMARGGFLVEKLDFNYHFFGADCGASTFHLSK